MSKKILFSRCEIVKLFTGTNQFRPNKGVRRPQRVDSHNNSTTSRRNWPIMSQYHQLTPDWRKTHFDSEDDCCTGYATGKKNWEHTKKCCCIKNKLLQPMEVTWPNLLNSKAQNWHKLKNVCSWQSFMCLSLKLLDIDHPLTFAESKLKPMP